MALEIERRFLIKLPLAWYAKFKLNKCQLIHIHQTYLNEMIPGIKNSHSRVRYSEYELGGGYAEIKYTYTYKNPIRPGVAEEVEFVIDKKEYFDRLKDTDRSRRRIVKDRYEVPFFGRKFELDIFKGDLEGLSIMEVELESLNAKVHFPPFFEIIQEITNNKEYSNYQLASIDAQGLVKLATMINGGCSSVG